MSPHKKIRLFSAVLALVLCASAGVGNVSEIEFKTSKPDSSGEEREVIFADLAEVFRKHCVQVYIHGKSHEGKVPSFPNYANDIRNERPTMIGGYWWDDKHVIIEDHVLQDQFIRSIEVGFPFSDRRYPARVAGRFIKLQAILLEVLPGEGGVMPQALPLQFVDGDLDESAVLTYSWIKGEWSLTADAGLGTSSITDGGMETVKVAASGVIVNDDAMALGLAFGERLILDEESPYWSGRELPYTAFFSDSDASTLRRRLNEKLKEAVLEAKFRLRVKIDDDEDEDSEWTIDLDDAPPSRGTPAEIRAAAMVVGPHHLLVPIGLSADGIARIEDIVIIDASGAEIQAEFIGAVRDYMAVVVQTEKELPVGNLPAGFTLLNPLVLSEEAFQPGSKTKKPVMEYFERRRVDYSLGRRRETSDYDRWLGTFQGYRGDSVVNTFTNEEDGSLAFDIQGNLIAVALTPRVLSSQSRTGSMQPLTQNIRVTSGFRPLDFISKRLHTSDVFNPAMRPVDEEAGQRLIDIGVEFQGLDANTARLFSASSETRGGRIGLLVTYVYPESPASQIGLRQDDILLRLFIAGKNEPMELRTSGFSPRSFLDFSDMSSQNFQQMLMFMPPPWPSREDVLSTILTGAGVGREATIEYLREGELKRAEFVTRYTAPDYRNAKKEKFPALGLTAKPITYEVQRFYRRPDTSGVIISKVEEGGKSSVAGLHHYLIITQVNGEPVLNIEDFRNRVEKFEKGEASSVELTVDGFGKTRLVKIE